MAASASITITGTVTDLPSGSRSISPAAISSSAAVDSSLQIELASGDNEIEVPDGATAAIIVFDASSATTKKLKGVTGDTGITLTDTDTVVLPLGSSVTSFYINSSAADTDLLTTVCFV